MSGHFGGDMSEPSTCSYYTVSYMVLSSFPRRIKIEKDVPKVKRSPSSAVPPLHVECFVLCDYVQLAGGKLNIVGGGWDRITPVQLPMTYAFHLAIKLVGPSIVAERPVRLRLELAGGQGKTFDPPIPEMVLRFGRADASSNGSVAVFVPVDVELTIVLPGTYTFRLYADETIVAEAGFQVAEPRLGTSHLDSEEELVPSMKALNDVSTSDQGRQGS